MAGSAAFLASFNQVDHRTLAYFKAEDFLEEKSYAVEGQELHDGKIYDKSLHGRVVHDCIRPAALGVGLYAASACAAYFYIMVHLRNQRLECRQRYDLRYVVKDCVAVFQ